jgi:hypothetical protein
MTALGELTLEDAAKEAAGNWRSWTCFVWNRERDLSDPESWAIIYTHNRDSGLLDQSNAISKAMERFADTDDPDVVVESHSHWACGHVDGFSIRVFRDGQITDAFNPDISHAFRIYSGAMALTFVGFGLTTTQPYKVQDHRYDRL